MNSNWTCPSYKCKIMELLPFFLDIPENEKTFTVTPSRLIYELQMSSEDRLEQLNKPTRRRRTATKLNTFSKTPDIVVFQNFEADRHYRTTITLLNLQPVSRHLTIVNDRSPNFDVMPECSSIKIAPGMTYTAHIVFKPSEIRDHTHNINFMTDGETFSVPIYAIGCRPILNIPNCITLKPTAIRVPSQRSIVLHNCGKVQASYHVTCKEPFQVFPRKDEVMPNQSNEMKIICTPQISTTSIESDIVVMYDDIELKIPVTCDVVEAKIHLDADTVIFSEVYMGLQSYKTVTLHNKSPFSLDFQWKAYKSVAVEELERSKILEAMRDMNELEKKKYAKLQYLNVIDGEGHSLILDKELVDESETIETEMFLYKSKAFSILPLEGKIVPNQSLEFMVTFQPPKNDFYTSIAYLDVTGRENRQPISFAGGGKGPQVIFNVSTLNINDIFLQATHEYQLVVRNSGIIPATVEFIEKETDFGGVIKCSPKRQHLKCLEFCKTFIISFTSTVQGKFVEKIEFVIEESKEIVRVLMVGNVVCPLLRPNVGHLDFGEVSYGLKPVKEFALINDSQVPVDFKLKLAQKSQSELTDNEFHFEPNEGVVEANSSVGIKVTVNTHAIQDVNETLIVVMWGSRKYSTSIPLKFNCVCPEIQCTPSEVIINFCFLNYEYKRTITLKNTSHSYGYLTYTPLEEPKDMTCALNITESVIHPDEEIDIELLIQTNMLGFHEYPLVFTLSGKEPQTICKITCNGQGPVVSYDPDELNFGKVTLLQYVSKTLTLINDSPIWAKIHVSTPSNAPFQPDAEYLEIGPEDKKDVAITCYLTDNERFKSYVNIIIDCGESISISVLGEGIGSSILCEPQLAPEYDAGTLLTHQYFTLPVTFTNLGKKFYKIFWSRRQSIKLLKDISDEDDFFSNFRMEPKYFELDYKQSQSVQVIGHSKKAKVVHEDFYCHAAIDKSTKLENIMTCALKAEFIDPSVEFSQYSLNFLSIYDGDIWESRAPSETSMIPMLDYEDRKQVMTENIKITNGTSTQLSLNIQISGDFYIIDEMTATNKLHYRLSANDFYNAKIEFRPKLNSKRYSMKKGRITVDVSDHPKTNTVNLTGEVCFPTVKLHPNTFDFECIPPYSYSFTKIILQNTTFLPVTYSWELFEDMFEIEELQEVKVSNLANELCDSSTSSSVTEEISSIQNQADLEVRSTNTSLNKNNLRTSKVRIDKKHFAKKVPSIKMETSSKTSERQSVSFTKEKSSEAFIEWDSPRYGKEMKNVLKDIVSEFASVSDETFLFEEMKSRDISSLKKILTIEPSQGELEPYEYVLVTIGFFPPPNVRVKCTALCGVDGGEKEQLLITGMSSSISYKLDKEKIEFGRKLFCEVCEESLSLTNDGHANFFFKIIDKNQSSDASPLTAGWLNVSPSKHFLRSGETIKIVVKYFPGITGEFQKDIFFEIGYLDAVKVQLHGYAVSSQLVLSLPRPILQNIPVAFMYRAVASITEKYLLLMNNIKTKNLPQYVVDHGCPDDMSDVMYHELRRNGWVTISDQDLYPSQMEIDLAIERVLLNEHITNNSEILAAHTLTQNVDVIPEFTVPPYNLDFGYVIVDKPVCYTVLILNCAPIAAHVRLAKNERSTLEDKELRIEFQNKKLETGDMTELFVVFNPTEKKFGLEEKQIEDRFQLKLNHGGLIPITIRANVTRPKIKVKYGSVDFGSVKLGTVLRRSIVIENDGYLLSKWCTEVESTNKKHQNAYWILPNNGELLPGKKGLLNIYFAPSGGGFHGSQVTIRIEGNAIPIGLKLCGHGVEPKLVFSEKTLNFKNCLPFSQNNDKEFSVENVSTFPIEFCFSDFDQEYDEEKCYVNLFLETYNLKTILIPERQLGSRLPDVFRSNYNSILKQLKLKKIAVEDQDPEEENVAAAPSETPSKQSKMEMYNLMIDYVQSSDFEISDTKTDFNVVEDEFSSRMTIIEPEGINNSDLAEPRNGVFIIFHGAPDTAYYRAANTAARTLSLVVYSIDRLICEELVKNKSVAAIEINNFIEKILKTNKTELEQLPEEDGYDLLLRKLQTLSTVNMRKIASKMKPDKERKSDKGSDRKSGSAKSGASTLAGISAELLCDLLRKRFENDTEGIVIESLHSEFFKTVNVSFDYLLRAIGNVKYIHFIVLSYTLEDYIRNEEIRLLSEEKAEEIVNIVSPEKESKKGTPRPKSTAKSDTKQIIKSLPKPLKGKFDEFREFLNEFIYKCEYWERRYQGLLKSPGSRVIASRMDTKSSTKDSGKESKSSAKKRRTLTSESNFIPKYAFNDTPGISLWIFSNCKDDSYVDPDMFSTLLKNNSELENAMKDLNRGMEVQIEESNTTFSVLKRSRRKKNIQTSQFRIYNSDIDIVKPDEQIISLTGSKRKGSKRKLSIDKRSDLVSLTFVMKDITKIPFMPRSILQPGGTLKYHVSFLPTHCGKYTYNYRLAILGQEFTHSVQCYACCELPSIDVTPEIMFPQCRESYREKAINDRFVYFKEENVFDFGSIIVGTNKSPPYKTTLTLQNRSDLQCVSTIELNENSLFTINPDTIVVEPEKSAAVTLSLKALKKGKVKGEMYISIQNNPEVYTIKLQAHACALDFRVTPKLLYFDKIPTGHNIKKFFTLTNSSPVDLFWKFVKFDWAHDIYKMSKTNGIINLYSIEDVFIEYAPSEEETNPKKNFELQIFDLHQSEAIPLHVDSIALQSDAVEYIVEYQDYIDLGERKGKINYKIPFSLFNKGKSSVNVAFYHLDNILPEDDHLIRRFFKLNSENEIIPSQKTTTVTIQFHPVIELHFTNTPIFRCNFVETDRPQNIISSFIISFSGTVYLSKFVTCPLTEMYFGCQQIDSSRSQTLEVKNTGSFAFSYTIQKFGDITAEKPKKKPLSRTGKSETESRKASSKKSDVGSSKSKDKLKEKKNITKLVVPGFILSPSTGVVEPGETARINVECFLQERKRYEETVIIFVSEPQKEDVKGRKIVLKAEGSEPILNFSDFHKMFKEQYIVQEIEQFRCPQNIGSHCIFVKSEVALYFKNVCVNDTYSTKVYLQNLGQVTANVTMKMLEAKNHFSVSPNSVIIGPYATEYIIIGFKPDSINTFENKLEISYNSTANNTHLLSLIGQSCVPQIKLLKPNVDENNCASLDFEPTYRDLSKSKEISVQNFGRIPCKVILDLYDNPKEMFSLKPCEDTVDMMNLCGDKDYEETKYSTMVNILPSKTANFSLSFLAKLECAAHALLKIHTVNNPFEIIRIDVTAQAYYNDIYLGELPTLNLQKSSPTKGSIGYILNFGYTSLNRLEKKCFTITNYSSKSTYKFEFANIGKLTMTPRVGHLKPLASKEIIATISTRNPMCSEKIKIECKYIPIEYVDPDLEDISWDDRQQLVPLETPMESMEMTFHTKNQYFQEAINIAKREVLRLGSIPATQQDESKCIIDRSEPDINILSNAWETIPIFFSITADYASYGCQIRELIIPDTYVNQKNEVSFAVINNGLIPLEIKWLLSCDEILPKRVSSATFRNETKETLLAPAPSLETSLSSTTLFSSETFMGDEPLPFQVIPVKSVIQPMQTETFRLVFAPSSASQYYLRLVSDIPSLDPCLRNMDITVTAESFVPDCYFELEEMTGYGERPTIRKCDGWDFGNARVLEMVSVGVGVTSTRKFHVMNTSSVQLPFNLEPLDAGNSFTYFLCKTPSGNILPGKKSELIFDFTPHELGIFEENYLFSIEANEFYKPFLLVGKCRIPRVYFAKAHVDITATLLNNQSRETVILRNEEDIELGFKFVKSSFYSEDHEYQIKVVPLAGVILPNSHIDIHLIYDAEKIGQSNFHLKCAIERMKTPLNLSVTAACKEVKASVTYTNKKGVEIPLDPKIENCIDLGNIGINTKRELKFQIWNKGQTGFFYAWRFNKKNCEHFLKVSSENGKEMVVIGHSSKTKIIFEANRKYVLKDFRMKLEISFGPTYILKLNAIAADPLCKFSFKSYDFGYCLIQKLPSKYYGTVLEMKNCQVKPAVLECHFENTDDLTVEFKSEKVLPNCVANIPIYFHPRKAKRIELAIPFMVDSAKRAIKISGEGVKLNIQLANPNDKFIRFDGVKLGHAKKHRLQIVNKTLTNIDISLNLFHQLPSRTRDVEKLEPEIRVPDVPQTTTKESQLKKKTASSMMISDKEHQNQIDSIDKKETKREEVNHEDIKKYGEYLTIYPKDSVSIEACRKCDFSVEFRPRERIEKFSGKIYYKVQDYLEPLCVLNGSCIAPEFSLDKDVLTFSNVIIGCKHKLIVLLKNTGDTRGSFKWKFDEPAIDFKLYPMEGFITPKSEMKVWISFEPTEVHCQIFKKVKCVLDGNISLDLQLIANSLDLPQPLSVVHFSCPVRQTIAEKITIWNNTKTRWYLKPRVSESSFLAPMEITVEPECSNILEIRYNPKQLYGTQPDKATLVLPLPEGQAIVYDLVGNALPPLPIKRLMVDVVSKQNHTEILSVDNWLEVKQCFEVETELCSTATTKTLYKAFGHNMIDVPPNGSRNYKWNIYVINEEPLDFKVKFINIETREYIFYELSIKVLPSGHIDIINLNSRVREQVKTTIKLKNPINIFVTYNLSGGTTEIHFEKVVHVEPYSTHDLDVFYCPLKEGDISTNIVAKCEELGVFSYKLNLKAIPPPLEKVFRFKAELGEKAYNSFTLKNTFFSPVELSSTFDHPEFSTSQSAPLLSGEVGKFTIKFEPSDLGLLESKAVFSSPVTGDYIYPLVGECVLPTPKGPFFVKSGGTIYIPFYNPFMEQKQFEFSINSDSFQLKSTSESLKARKSTKIIVSLPMTKNHEADSRYPLTARLVAKCEDTNLEFIKWTFYIQGDR